MTQHDSSNEVAIKTYIMLPSLLEYMGGKAKPPNNMREKVVNIQSINIGK